MFPNPKSERSVKTQTPVTHVEWKVCKFVKVCTHVLHTDMHQQWAHRHSRGVCTVLVNGVRQAGRQVHVRTSRQRQRAALVHCNRSHRSSRVPGASKPPPSMRATAEQTVSIHQRGYTHCSTCSMGQAPHAHSPAIALHGSCFLVHKIGHKL